MIKLPRELYDCVKPLFAGYSDTLVRSTFDGFWGEIWVDRVNNPQTAVMYTDFFTYFGGDASHPCTNAFLLDFPWEITDGVLCLVPQSDAWDARIREILGTRAQRGTRWSIHHEPDIFDECHLRALRAALPEEYTLERIDTLRYIEALSADWSASFCVNFRDWEHFRDCGIGFVAVKDGKIVAGASSYSAYNGGIEVQVETHVNHRRRGIAQACAAALILACRERGLYASWDAANRESVALACKLGYREKGPYTVYYFKKPKDTYTI